MSGIDHLGIDLRVRFGAEVKQLRFPFRHPVTALPPRMHPESPCPGCFAPSEMEIEGVRGRGIERVGGGSCSLRDIKIEL